MTNDTVNHPAHYTSNPSGIETIQITEHMSFLLGNVVKYVMRCDHKGAPIEDLEKAAWYLAREIEKRKAAEAAAVAAEEEAWRSLHARQSEVLADALDRAARQVLEQDDAA